MNLFWALVITKIGVKPLLKSVEKASHYICHCIHLYHAHVALLVYCVNFQWFYLYDLVGIGCIMVYACLYHRERYLRYEEKENEQNNKDKIENLTREGKERLVREYIRRKIERVLLEQPTAAEPEEPVEDIPADDTMPAEPTAEPAATETPTPPATPTPTDIPAPAAETPAEPVAPAAPEATPEELENRVITNVASELEKEGAVGKIDMISKILKLSMKETDPADKSMFFKLLRAYAIKKISQIEPEISQSK
jgi:hypothetical protein